MKLSTYSCFAPLILALGCTTTADSGRPPVVQRWGNQILQTVGITERPSTYTMQSGLLNATTEISPENEYFLGRAVAARILGKFHEQKDRDLKEYLNYITNVLAASSDRPATFSGYHVVVLESDAANAVAAPSGFIFVTTGLLKQLPDEDAIAAVLAHEVTHVEKSHALKSVSKDRLDKALTSLGVAANSLYCGQVLQEALVVLGAAVDDITNILLERGFTRAQEFEADAGSVRIMTRAGYNPYALVVVLTDLLNSSGTENQGWFATHPPAKDRLQMVSTILPPDSKDIASIDRHQRFQQAMSKVTGA